ncbi:hypothetical protein ACSLBF_10705 [Pseudoalteromonas sp. T1lg65]|uniref:hypothetical protein n=1 Tax=Pseudoalteromonas sp. T1lg65 TaxID=2077101 RepID=UPI003F7A1E4B
MLQTNSSRLAFSSTAATKSNIVNTVYVADEIVASLELLKILHVDQTKLGWTLLIAPDNVPNKAMLENSNIDSSKLLIIRQKHIYNLEYVLQSAIKNGNFASVVIWTNISSPKAIEEMLSVNNSKTGIHCFSNPLDCTMQPEMNCA